MTYGEFERFLKKTATDVGLEIESVRVRPDALYGYLADVIVRKTPKAYSQYLELERRVAARFRALGQDAPRAGWYEWSGVFPDIPQGCAMVEFDLFTLRPDAPPRRRRARG